MNEHFENRKFLATAGLNRCLLGQISDLHFHRYLDQCMQYIGEKPDIETVNRLVALTGSTRIR